MATLGRALQPAQDGCWRLQADALLVLVGVCITESDSARLAAMPMMPDVARIVCRAHRPPEWTPNVADAALAILTAVVGCSATAEAARTELTAQALLRFLRGPQAALVSRTPDLKALVARTPALNALVHACKWPTAASAARIRDLAAYAVDTLTNDTLAAEEREALLLALVGFFDRHDTRPLVAEYPRLAGVAERALAVFDGSPTTRQHAVRLLSDVAEHDDEAQAALVAATGFVERHGHAILDAAEHEPVTARRFLSIVGNLEVSGVAYTRAAVTWQLLARVIALASTPGAGHGGLHDEARLVVRQIADVKTADDAGSRDTVFWSGAAKATAATGSAGGTAADLAALDTCMAGDAGAGAGARAGTIANGTRSSGLVSDAARTLDSAVDRLNRKADPSAATAETCVVCMDAPRQHVMVPCGHLCACASCASAMVRRRSCPMCRATVTNSMRVFVC